MQRIEEPESRDAAARRRVAGSHAASLEQQARPLRRGAPGSPAMMTPTAIVRDQSPPRRDQTMCS